MKNISIETLLMLLGEKDVIIYQLNRQIAELKQQLSSYQKDESKGTQ